MFSLHELLDCSLLPLLNIVLIIVGQLHKEICWRLHHLLLVGPDTLLFRLLLLEHDLDGIGYIV